MGCGCGKEIVNIVKGYKALTEEKLKKLFKMDSEPEQWVKDRLQMCKECGGGETHLTVKEFAGFLTKHGVEIVKVWGDLEKLPRLPRKEEREGTKMFCRHCKCWCEAKARVKDERCKMGRWTEIDVKDIIEVTDDK